MIGDVTGERLELLQAADAMVRRKSAGAGYIGRYSSR